MADRPMNGAATRAYEAGQVARREGKGLEVIPEGYLAAKSLSAAWRKGWHEGVVVQHVEVVVREPVVHAQALFLAPNAPLPSVYVRPQPVACRLCRCVRLENRSQAVVLDHTFGSIAVLKCRACQGAFKLPIATEGVTKTS